jgi:hypothetical protein
MYIVNSILFSTTESWNTLRTKPSIHQYPSRGGGVSASSAFFKIKIFVFPVKRGGGDKTSVSTYKKELWRDIRYKLWRPNSFCSLVCIHTGNRGGAMLPQLLTRNRGGAMLPQLLTRNRGGAMLPQPLTRNRGGAMLPQPLTRNRGGAMLPQPLTRNRGGAMLPQPQILMRVAQSKGRITCYATWLIGIPAVIMTPSVSPCTVRNTIRGNILYCYYADSSIYFHHSKCISKSCESLIMVVLSPKKCVISEKRGILF